jgi:hypothetical protein
MAPGIHLFYLKNGRVASLAKEWLHRQYHQLMVGATTLSITTFNIMTFSITIKNTTLSIMTFSITINKTLH